MRPTTPLAVENGVGKLAAKVRQMSAWERECGELPSPNLSLFDREVGQGLFVFIRGKAGMIFKSISGSRQKCQATRAGMF
jgi:hypothetical protein